MIQVNDLINGSFEAVGGVLIWLNVVAIRRDKQVKGVNLWAWIFYSVWAGLGLFYYACFGQWVSFAGDAVIMLGNVAWVCLALKYKYFTKRRNDDRNS